METWYRTGGYGADPVEAVEAIRATKKMLVIKRGLGPGERRVAKQGSYHNYFQSRPEAIAYVRRGKERSVKYAKEALRLAEKALKAFEMWVNEQN
jgi:hypothetical protein